MGVTDVRLMDRADRVVFAAHQWPVSALRPRMILWCPICASQTCEHHPYMTFYASAAQPDGTWLFRSDERFP